MEVEEKKDHSLPVVVEEAMTTITNNNNKGCDEVEGPSKTKTEEEVKGMEPRKKRKRGPYNTEDSKRVAGMKTTRRRSNTKSPSSTETLASNVSTKPNSDSYCWTCHKEGVLVCCDVCPRSYHLRCTGLAAVGEGDWVCPECELVLGAENTDTRSPAMHLLDLDQLCTLLKFALSRMKIQCPEEFLRPVPLDEFPSYSNFVIHPVDMSTLEKNIKQRMYGSTESFVVDAKWILHNCIIYNGFQHKLTSVAKTIIKVCQQEMAEIEVCPDCYHNAHTKRENWFQETCNLPHLLVWAKLKGFPFWPGKAMKIVSGSVDVRFFGAHDRAWIPVGQCYLLSKSIPTPLRNKKRVFEQSMEELEQHVRKLKEKFGEFQYAPPKTRFQAKDVLTHLQNMLPKLENPSRLERFLLTREEGAKNSQDEGERRLDGEDSKEFQTKEQTTNAKTPWEVNVKNLENTIEKIKAKGTCSVASENHNNDESILTCEATSTSNRNVGLFRDMNGSNRRSVEEKEGDKSRAASLLSRSSLVEEERSGDEFEKVGAFGTDVNAEDEDDCDDNFKMDVEDGDELPKKESFGKAPSCASSSSSVVGHKSRVEIRVRSPSIYEGVGVGKYSKKMTEFMHATMEEMFRDLTKKTSRNSSSFADRVTIRKLEFEIEKLKWQHRQEMAETKHNNDLVLMEMRNSVEADTERRIAQVRRQCELAKAKAVSETKRKQWCALCGKEANFYCCWNTSYCDYPCQEAHWPIHVNSCTQSTSPEESSSPLRRDAQVQFKRVRLSSSLSSTARHKHNNSLVRALKLASSRKSS